MRQENQGLSASDIEVEHCGDGAEVFPWWVAVGAVLEISTDDAGLESGPGAVRVVDGHDALLENRIDVVCWLNKFGNSLFVAECLD